MKKMDSRRQEETSLLNWYPKIKNLDEINVPDTVIVDVNIMEPGEEGYNIDCPIEYDMDEIIEAIEEVRGPPAFIRTDMASYKHGMNKSSKITSKDEEHIMNHIYELICFNEMAQMGGLPYSALVIREWLDLEHEFEAFNGTPIAQELRVFVESGELLCHHFYWPKDSIEFRRGQKEPRKWKEMWRRTRDKTLMKVEEVKLMAEKVAQIMGGSWSVDFARSKDGKWYLIDMARKELSWHPEGCEYS